MTVYFDHTDPADLALLPVALRTAKDLDDLAPMCEQDVIGAYTRRQQDFRYTVLDTGAAAAVAYATRPTFVFSPRGMATDIGGGVRVYLTGYMPDASDPLTDANLRNALKREIAEVVKWRLYQSQRDPGVQSEGGQGGRTRSMRVGADDLFPKSFGFWLRNFDTRPPQWAV